MERARMSVTGWAVATVVVGIAISGCGNNSKTSSPPSKSAATTAVSTSAGPPPDYSALLIQPNDLGGDFTAPDPPVLNFNNTTGVAQLFVNADNSRRIGDTILCVLLVQFRLACRVEYLLALGEAEPPAGCAAAVAGATPPRSVSVQKSCRERDPTLGRYR